MVAENERLQREIRRMTASQTQREIQLQVLVSWFWLHIPHSALIQVFIVVFRPSSALRSLKFDRSILPKSNVFVRRRAKTPSRSINSSTCCRFCLCSLHRFWTSFGT
jgi:hypothetical protein